jgi:hypothetical protein
MRLFFDIKVVGLWSAISRRNPERIRPRFFAPFAHSRGSLSAILSAVALAKGEALAAADALQLFASR